MNKQKSTPKKKDPKLWLRIGCLVFAALMILSLVLTLVMQVVVLL